LTLLHQFGNVAVYRKGYKMTNTNKTVITNGARYGISDHPLWSQILPNLWQGGTDWGNDRPFTVSNFDSVYTLNRTSAAPASYVKEVRFGFSDGNLTDINPNEDLYELARSAHRDWKNGKRVLIRCAAGWNRSGIVMALVLIRDGYSVEDTINLIREKRCPEALCNTTFTNWLRSEVHENLHFWRN